MQKHRIHALCLAAFSPSLLLSPLSSFVSASFFQFVHLSNRAYCVSGLAPSAGASKMNNTLRWDFTLKNHVSRAA